MSGVVVTGMHRSATSLTARMLAAGGWHPGEALLTSEREEYFEEASFVALHRAWIEEDLRGEVPVAEIDSHRDWGILDAKVPAHLGSDDSRLIVRAQEARDYATVRQGQHGTWAAKDPRASLYVDVWSQVEDVRFVLLYRNPWDVVDSALRLGAEVFCRRPRIVLGAWLDYHARLVRFARANRERVTVVAAEVVAHAPERAWALFAHVLGMRTTAPAGLIDPARFVHRDDNHAIASLYQEVYPEHAALLAELDALADLPRPAPLRSRVQRRPSIGGSLPPGRGVQVVIPCRDDGDFLAEAIASVEECSLPAVELTLVDDGSTDPETCRVFERLSHSGRHVLRADGVGLAAARNAGCATSRTSVVIPLDADNRLRPAARDAVALLERTGADLVHGSWSRFGMDSGRVVPPDMTLETLLPYNQIDALALIRRSLLDRLGGWDEQLPFWEDWDFWLRAADAGAHTHRVSDVLHDYLVRPGSLSMRPLSDRGLGVWVLDRILSKHPGSTESTADAWRAFRTLDPEGLDEHPDGAGAEAG